VKEVGKGGAPGYMSSQRPGSSGACSNRCNTPGPGSYEVSRRKGMAYSDTTILPFTTIPSYNYTTGLSISIIYSKR